MEQEKKPAATKRKRKEGTGARKRRRGPDRGRAGAGEGETQEEKAVAADVAEVVGKVAECVQEEDYQGIAEESVAEMMSLLELELTAAPATATSSSSATAMAPPAGYVTVEESCGPSFSGSASTMMASVDVRFVVPMPPVLPWPWPEVSAAAAAAAEEEELAVDDDAWVEQLLTDGPPEEEEQYRTQ